jgi:hypothetical protein
MVEGDIPQVDQDINQNHHGIDNVKIEDIIVIVQNFMDDPEYVSDENHKEKDETFSLV